MEAWTGRTERLVTGAGYGRRQGDAPALTMDARDVRTSYLDFVGRPPFERELRRWSGMNRHALATALLGCEEFWQHWISEQLFYLMLIDNFRPSGDAIEELPAGLATHLLTPREALHRLVLSSSFDLRNPGADTFVTVVMEQLVGRVVQSSKGELAGGKAAYDGREARFLGKPASNQADVIRIAIEDRAATAHLLEREYWRILHRAPDPRELRGWIREVHREPSRLLEVMRLWYLSEPYDRRLEQPVAKPNRLFVRSLFVDLMGRVPTQDELEPLRSALDGLADSRPLRSVVVRALIGSELVTLNTKKSISNPEAWVSGRFERLLGRTPQPSELEVFVEAFADESCGLDTILYALVSGTEYQSY
ncbi:MAG: hypothetical protein ACI8Y8_001965 [Planctomycetota bacterium]|jgi:hypothetical protein